MTWTLWGLVVQTIAGFLGAHAAAGVAREYRLGFIGHSLAGLVGGALSGTFLQTAAVTIVTGSGSQNPSTAVEIAAIHGLTHSLNEHTFGLERRILGHSEIQTWILTFDADKLTVKVRGRACSQWPNPVPDRVAHAKSFA